MFKKCTVNETREHRQASGGVTLTDYALKVDLDHKHVHVNKYRAQGGKL